MRGMNSSPDPSIATHVASRRGRRTLKVAPLQDRKTRLAQRHLSARPVGNNPWPSVHCTATATETAAAGEAAHPRGRYAATATENAPKGGRARCIRIPPTRRTMEPTRRRPNLHGVKSQREAGAISVQSQSATGRETATLRGSRMRVASANQRHARVATCMLVAPQPEASFGGLSHTSPACQLIVHTPPAVIERYI